MKVSNMKSLKGNTIANQFDIDAGDCTYFQSYNKIIAKYDNNNMKTYLDINAWDYSRTTAKYRNMWLGETTKEIKDKINSGEYILTDLN
jgi:hypothetical protein